jgi:hypothetical protein
MSTHQDHDDQPVGREAVRAYLEGIMTPEDISTLDGLVAQLRENPPLDQQFGRGEHPEGQTTAEAIHEFLEDRLYPEQLTMLESLVREVDTGLHKDARRDAVNKFTEAAQVRKDDDMNHAHDDDQETATLRQRLRRAGVPVGNYGDVNLLRRVARDHGLRLGA